MTGKNHSSYFPFSCILGSKSI
uniref:Uncharacterized protein n=1 Tax=Arundo donax TaxID=35708 RepID=A0A0A9B7L6_ARUDO